MVFFFWPETKGVSLEHIDRIFDGVDKVTSHMKEHSVQDSSRGLKVVEKEHLEDVNV